MGLKRKLITGRAGCRMSALAAAALLSILAIGCEDGMEEEMFSIEEENNAIINGDVVSTDSMGIAFISLPGGSCTGTVLSPHWILTAEHCTVAGQESAHRVRVNGVTATVDRIVQHPNLDVALLHVNRALPDPRINPIYTGTGKSLEGKTVLCQGYGRNTYDSNDGNLRQALLKVKTGSNTDLYMEPNATGQIQWFGDSGGPCFYTFNGVPHVVSVSSWGTYSETKKKIYSANLVSAEGIIRWIYNISGVGAWFIEPNYYMAYNPDVARASSNNRDKAIEHFENSGIAEGRLGSPSYGSVDYLALNPGVAKAYGSTNYQGALSHLQNFGMNEGRRTSLAFDVKYYLGQYSDLRRAFGNTGYMEAASHFALFGLKEGRRSSPVFDVAWYLNKYSDLRSAFGANGYQKALVHWQKHGLGEGRQAHPDFSPVAYLNRYADLRKAFGEKNYRAATIHYLRFGISEGRNGKP